MSFAVVKHRNVETEIIHRCSWSKTKKSKSVPRYSVHAHS